MLLSCLSQFQGSFNAIIILQQGTAPEWMMMVSCWVDVHKHVLVHQKQALL